MSSAEYRDVQVRVEGSVLEVSLAIGNKTRETWKPENFSLGCQFFDPQSNRFIEEGAWTPVAGDIAPGATAKFEISIPFPPEEGAYEIYLSHIQPSGGWAYASGDPFLRILVEAGSVASGGQLRVLSQEITTLRALRWRKIRTALPSLFATVIKRLIGRARPYVGTHDDPFAYMPFVWKPEYASMPSGHATTALAAAIAIGAVWPRLRPVMWR